MLLSQTIWIWFTITHSSSSKGYDGPLLTPGTIHAGKTIKHTKQVN